MQALEQQSSNPYVAQLAGLAPWLFPTNATAVTNATMPNATMNSGVDVGAFSGLSIDTLTSLDFGALYAQAMEFVEANGIDVQAIVGKAVEVLGAGSGALTTIVDMVLLSASLIADVGFQTVLFFIALQYMVLAAESTTDTGTSAHHPIAIHSSNACQGSTSH